MVYGRIYECVSVFPDVIKTCSSQQLPFLLGRKVCFVIPRGTLLHFIGFIAQRTDILHLRMVQKLAHLQCVTVSQHLRLDPAHIWSLFRSWQQRRWHQRWSVVCWISPTIDEKFNLRCQQSWLAWKRLVQTWGYSNVIGSISCNWTKKYSFQLCPEIECFTQPKPGNA